MTPSSGNDTVPTGNPTQAGGAPMAGTGGGRAFPEGFTWGTATAAHQIEGGNTNNDWWAFEHTPGIGMRRAVGRRLRLVGPLGAGCRPRRRPRIRQPPLLGGVEPYRAGRGRVLPGRAGPLSAPVRPVARAGHRPRRDLPSLHDTASGSRHRVAGRAISRSSASGGSAPSSPRRWAMSWRAPAPSTNPTSWRPWAGTPGCSRPARATWRSPAPCRHAWPRRTVWPWTPSGRMPLVSPSA